MCFNNAKFNNINIIGDFNMSRYCNDLDQCIITFYQLIHNCFVACVPKVLQHSNHGPHWNTKYLLRLKNKLYKPFKTDRSIINYSKFCLVRSEYTIVNQRAYNIYLNNEKNKFKGDPKSTNLLIRNVEQQIFFML